MPGADYARAVVHEALKASPRAHFYAGKLSWVVPIIISFFPLGFMVSIPSFQCAMTNLVRRTGLVAECLV